MVALSDSEERSVYRGQRNDPVCGARPKEYLQKNVDSGSPPDPVGWCQTGDIQDRRGRRKINASASLEEQRIIRKPDLTGGVPRAVLLNR